MIVYHKSELGCGLLSARDLREADAAVRQDIGAYHAAAGYSVREATAEDIAWVSAMGGVLPDELRPRRRLGDNDRTLHGQAS